MPLPTTPADPAAVVVALLGLDWVVEQVSGAWWTYPVIVGATAFDALLPIVPAETVIITAAVTAATGGGLSIVLIIASAALGGVIGDNASYLLGRTVGEPAARRLFSGEKSRERLEWATRVVHRHGGVMVLAARFVPGGRTAITFASGTVGWSWREFAAVDAAAAVLWALYVSMLGYLFGETFTRKPWLAIVVSFVVAGVVTLVGEVVRRVRSGGEQERGDAERDPAGAAGT